jgi:hypothetical protein
VVLTRGFSVLDLLLHCLNKSNNLLGREKQLLLVAKSTELPGDYWF